MFATQILVTAACDDVPQNVMRGHVCRHLRASGLRYGNMWYQSDTKYMQG